VLTSISKVKDPRYFVTYVEVMDFQQAMARFHIVQLEAEQLGTECERERAGVEKGRTRRRKVMPWPGPELPQSSSDLTWAPRAAGRVRAGPEPAIVATVAGAARL
jgi:hypothetical protein